MELNQQQQAVAQAVTKIKDALREIGYRPAELHCHPGFDLLNGFDKFVGLKVVKDYGCLQGKFFVV